MGLFEMLAFGEMPQRPRPVVEVDITPTVWHVADFRGVSVVVDEPTSVPGRRFYFDIPSGAEIVQ